MGEAIYFMAFRTSYIGFVGFYSDIPAIAVAGNKHKCKRWQAQLMAQLLSFEAVLTVNMVRKSAFKTKSFIFIAFKSQLRPCIIAQIVLLGYIKKIGSHTNYFILLLWAEKALLFHICNIITPGMGNTVKNNCFIIKKEHGSAVKMRVYNLLGFTVIPHCIVTAVLPVLKENALGRDMQLQFAFFYARMLEKNFRFACRYMIHRNLVSHIEKQVILTEV